MASQDTPNSTLLPPFIRQKMDDLQALCREHHVQALYLFGSALRDDFDLHASDLDWIVEFEPDMPRRGFDDPYFLLMDDLEKLFGRPIDLVEWGAIQNPYFKAAVRPLRRSVYAA